MSSASRERTQPVQVAVAWGRKRSDDALLAAAVQPPVLAAVFLPLSLRWQRVSR